VRLKVIVHETPSGGYWAQVPGIPGCATQGDTLAELQRNICEAVEGCLGVAVGQQQGGGSAGRVLEIDL
jgi:predicted RNase H-like HicB family nuclease